MWKVDEGPDEENKSQIIGKIETAIQIIGDAETYHLRICWHSHKQVNSHLHDLYHLKCLDCIYSYTLICVVSSCRRFCMLELGIAS